MKTELTKRITDKLKAYKPNNFSGIKINQFRPRRTVFEMPVECGTIKLGLIDCVITAEYFSNLQKINICRYFNNDIICDHKDEKSYRCNMQNGSCQYQHHKEADGTADILFVCLEIKVSRADFLSKHGHNFCGNLNYYVMPYDLYLECKQDIPSDIGVITLDRKESSLKQTKASEFKELSDNTQKWMILSVLKAEERAWRQKERERYMRQCEKSRHATIVS